jgi:hypoxanthine phosphoribosyltransferase
LTLSQDVVVRRTGGREVKAIVFTAAQIQERVAELGAELTRAYPDGDLLLIGLLKGSFLFLADLVRHIERPVAVDFMVASSYGDSTVSSGNVRILYDPAIDLAGRHVVLVEDIVDSGNTLRRLLALLVSRRPASLAVCALLDKSEMHAPFEELRFVGFDAPPAFLIGYGLDYAEQYRHLPFIADMA